MALRSASPQERRQTLTALPGGVSVPRDAQRSFVAVEEYGKLLAIHDEQSLTDGSTSLLQESWIDLYRYLKTLGRTEEARRALLLALEVSQRSGRAPLNLPELGFEEALQDEGIPLPR